MSATDAAVRPAAAAAAAAAAAGTIFRNSEKSALQSFCVVHRGGK